MDAILVILLLIGALALFTWERHPPDLTALGKVIGGGLPCAAYGGREALISFLGRLQAAGWPVRGLHEMDAAELSSRTGLPPESAEAALQREPENERALYLCGEAHFRRGEEKERGAQAAQGVPR